MRSVEVKMTMKDRFLDAAYTLFSLWMAGVFLLVWAPFESFRALMTKSKFVVMMNQPGKAPNPDDGEAWKREHDSEYN